jgi:hypothetical protein
MGFFLHCFVSGDDNVQHTLRSSTPSTTTGEEEASEGLTPILQKWFLESSNGSALGIGEGEQPSPVSILDSPFQDEVSITPEPSLAGHNFFLNSNQESYHQMSPHCSSRINPMRHICILFYLVSPLFCR